MCSLCTRWRSDLSSELSQDFKAIVAACQKCCRYCKWRALRRFVGLFVSCLLGCLVSYRPLGKPRPGDGTASSRGSKNHATLSSSQFTHLFSERQPRAPRALGPAPDPGIVVHRPERELQDAPEERVGEIGARPRIVLLRRRPSGAPKSRREHFRRPPLSVARPRWQRARNTSRS